MTTQDRLNKITALVTEREMEKQKILDHIASYADRIKDMLLIANTLYKNDISVSRFVAKFVASRENHILGFIYNKDSEYPYCAIGVLNQGYDSYDCWKLMMLYANKQDNYPISHGDIIINEKGIAEKFDTIWDCEGWTKDFEEFEKKFYHYVDNEI
jgi:hypothetical protein